MEVTARPARLTPLPVHSLVPKKGTGPKKGQCTHGKPIHTKREPNPAAPALSEISSDRHGRHDFLATFATKRITNRPRGSTRLFRSMHHSSGESGVLDFMPSTAISLQ